MSPVPPMLAPPAPMVSAPTDAPVPLLLISAPAPEPDATISRPTVHESYTRELPGLGSRVHVFTLVNEAGDKEVITLDDTDAPVALDARRDSVAALRRALHPSG